MKIGVLCIHGFTGGPYEVQPLVDFITERTDWVIEVPTLPGHGTTLQLEKVTAESWMMEAELAMRKLQKTVDRVIVVGFSMGGLIALYLANRYPVDRIVLLSAAAKYISPRQLLEDVKELLFESMSKRHTSTTFHHLFHYKLTHTPLRATIEFLRVVRMVERYYGNITVPVCIVQGRKDEIVPFTAAEHLYRSIGSEQKMLVVSDCGKHHICYSDDCDDWFQKVLEFMTGAVQ